MPTSVPQRSFKDTELFSRTSPFHPQASVESDNTSLGNQLYGRSCDISLPMAMMASASSGNANENYDHTEIEQDLIDPDDGSFGLPDTAPYTDVCTSSEH